MKRFLLVFIAAITLLPQAFAAGKDENPELKVMSYNIRTGSAKDGTNSWSVRYSATYDMLKDQAPDVFGVQEALDYQSNYIMDVCGYEGVGVGVENGKKRGEHLSIFWNKKTVSMQKWGTFWLSETPDKPSKGWGAEWKRAATWALMKCKKTGKRFYFVNTHLDHVSSEAQVNGMNVIITRIEEMNRNGYPVILAGDLNVTPGNKALDTLEGKMQDTREIAEKTDNLDTYNGWGKKNAIIDYIYVSGFSSVPEYQTVTERYQNRKFISDHYPVFARLIF